jgi:hypothetical protein
MYVYTYRPQHSLGLTKSVLTTVPHSTQSTDNQRICPRRMGQLTVTVIVLRLIEIEIGPTVSRPLSQKNMFQAFFAGLPLKCLLGEVPSCHVQIRIKIRHQQ